MDKLFNVCVAGSLRFLCLLPHHTPTPESEDGGTELVCLQLSAWSPLTSVLLPPQASRTRASVALAWPRGAWPWAWQPCSPWH